MQNKHGLRFTNSFSARRVVGKIWNSSSVALTNKPQIDSIQQLRVEAQARRVMSELGQNPNPSSALACQLPPVADKSAPVLARSRRAPARRSIVPRSASLNVMRCPPRQRPTSSRKGNAAALTLRAETGLVHRTRALYAIRLPCLRRSTAAELRFGALGAGFSGPFLRRIYGCTSASD